MAHRPVRCFRFLEKVKSDIDDLAGKYSVGNTIYPSVYFVVAWLLSPFFNHDFKVPSVGMNVTLI